MGRRSYDKIPRTTHRGYDISYSENEEVWSCSLLSLSAPKLSTLKGQIDRLIKRTNDQNGVRCLYLGYDDDAYEALVIGVKVQTRLEHTREGNKDIRRVYLRWMGNKGHGSERAVLHERDEIQNFIPDTPEVRAMLAEADRLQAAIDQAIAKRVKFIETIPRVTEDMFAALVPDAEPA